MPTRLDKFQEKVLKGRMPTTNIHISQRGSTHYSPNAFLVFHGQEYDLSAYMNEQGGGDVHVNITDKGVRIVSKKKRQYFQTALVANKQQLFQNVSIAEAEVEQQQQHFQAVPVAEAEHQHFQTVPVAKTLAEQQQHFQTVPVAEKQQHLWTVPVAIVGAVIVSFLYLRWK